MALVKRLYQKHLSAIVRAGVVGFLVIGGVLVGHCQDQIEVNSQAVLADSGAVLADGTVPYIVRPELGRLPAGALVKIAVELKNPFDFAISINKANASCQCINAALLGNQIPARGTAVFLASATTPKSATNPNQTLGFSLKGTAVESGQGVEVTILASYEISGLLSFSSPQALLEIPANRDMHDGFVSLVMTEPVKVENLIVEVDQELRDVVVTVESTSRGAGLRIAASRSSVEDFPVYGSIVVKDKETAAECLLHLSVRRQEPVVISLVVAWFRKFDREGEHGAEFYRASALVAIAELGVAVDKNRGTGRDQRQPPDPQITVRAEHFPEMKSEVIRLKPGLYRIKLEIAAGESGAAKLDRLEGELVWNIALSNLADKKFKTRYEIGN